MPAAVHTQRFVCPFFLLLLSECSLTHLQYPTQQFPQPRSHPSAQHIPSPLFAQTFYPQMYAPAGAHPSQHHHSRFGSHSRPRYHSHSPPVQYAQGPVSVPVQVNYPSQSRSRRGSTGDGSRVADFHINPALAYPSHSHSDPRYIQAKSILRNRGGPPPAPVVSYSH